MRGCDLRLRIRWAVEPGLSKDLGRLWDWLPVGGMFHDPYAYLKCQDGRPNPAGELVPLVAANGAATEAGTRKRKKTRKSWKPCLAAWQ
jgi:hypothetical protein